MAALVIINQYFNNTIPRLIFQSALCYLEQFDMRASSHLLTLVDSNLAIFDPLLYLKL